MKNLLSYLAGRETLRFAQGDNIKLITKITSLVILIAYDVLVANIQLNIVA